MTWPAPIFHLIFCCDTTNRVMCAAPSLPENTAAATQQQVLWYWPRVQRDDKRISNRKKQTHYNRQLTHTRSQNWCKFKHKHKFGKQDGNFTWLSNMMSHESSNSCRSSVADTAVFNRTVPSTMDSSLAAHSTPVRPLCNLGWNHTFWAY